MSQSRASAAPLAAVLWPVGARPWLRAVSLAVIGSLLLAASAKLQVPFWPVPMTLQTLVVLLIGAAYGWRLGLATVMLYLAQGAMGLPVFAGAAAGPAYFAGPTGGYLVGFALAAVMVGGLVDWQRNVLTAGLALMLGIGVIYGCGVAWLSVLIGWEKALAAGVVPFLPAEALKVALAAALVPAAWALARRRG